MYKRENGKFMKHKIPIGGPALCSMKLCALVSFGALKECNTGPPIGLTRVGEYADWISKNAGIPVVCR